MTESDPHSIIYEEGAQARRALAIIAVAGGCLFASLLVLARHLLTAADGHEALPALAAGLWLWWAVIGCIAAGILARTWLRERLPWIILASAALLTALALTFASVLMPGKTNGDTLRWLALATLPGLMHGALIGLAPLFSQKDRRLLPVALLAGCAVGGLFAAPMERQFGILNFSLVLAAILLASCVMLPRLPKSMKLQQVIFALAAVAALAIAFGGVGSHSMVDDVLPAKMPDAEARAEELVHLAMARHPSPEQVLIVGNYRDSMTQVLKQPVRHVDVVDHSLASSYSIELEGGKETGRKKRNGLRVSDTDYDIIIIDLPRPQGGRHGLVYSVEALDVLRERMNGSGLLALAFETGTPETPRDLFLLGSLHKTASIVFDHIELFTGKTNVLLMSNHALPPAAPETILHTLESRNISAPHIRREVLSLYPTEDEQQARQKAVAAGGQVIGRISRPFALVSDLALRAAPEGGRRGEVIRRIIYVDQAPLYWFAAIVMFFAGLVAVVFRRRPAGYGLIAGGIVHFTMLAVSMMTLQITRGPLRSDLGLLAAVLCAGSAAGYWLMSRYGELYDAEANRLFLSMHALACLYPLGIAAWGGMPGIVIIVLMLIVAGITLGANLRLGAFIGNHDRGASRAGACLLFGGGCGAILSSLFVIPLLGVVGASLWAAMAGGVALVVMVVRQ